VRYLLGLGVAENHVEAHVLTSSAATEEKQDAEVNLAAFTMYGIGTSPNEREAVRILHRYSASGSGIASNLLANWYEDGKGVTKNEEIANQLRVLAKKRGIDGVWVFNPHQYSWYRRMEIGHPVHN